MQWPRKMTMSKELGDEGARETYLLALNTLRNGESIHPLLLRILPFSARSSPPSRISLLGKLVFYPKVQEPWIIYP
jgi:hypothetical protein